MFCPFFYLCNINFCRNYCNFLSVPVIVTVTSEYLILLIMIPGRNSKYLRIVLFYMLDMFSVKTHSFVTPLFIYFFRLTVCMQAVFLSVYVMDHSNTLPKYVKVT